MLWDETKQLIKDLPYILLTVFLILTVVQFIRMMQFYLEEKKKAEPVWTYHKCCVYYFLETFAMLFFLLMFLVHAVFCCLTPWRVLTHVETSTVFIKACLGGDGVIAFGSMKNMFKKTGEVTKSDYTIILHTFLVALRPIRYKAVLKAYLTASGEELKALDDHFWTDISCQFGLFLNLLTFWRIPTLLKFYRWKPLLKSFHSLKE